jgi:ankyrin repeat protein
MIRAAEPRTGKTALHFAAENGSVAMVELLLRQGAGEPPPPPKCMARFVGCWAHVCADLNALSPSKQSPLHLATLHRRESTVRLLVERGAQLIQATTRGQKVRHMTSRIHHHTTQGLASR